MNLTVWCPVSSCIIVWQHFIPAQYPVSRMVYKNYIVVKFAKLQSTDELHGCMPRKRSLKRLNNLTNQKRLFKRLSHRVTS